MASAVRRFALLWSNDSTQKRSMSRHTFVLRDVLPTWCPPQASHCATSVNSLDVRGEPLLATEDIWDIYLDQIHVTFNPTTAILPGQYVAGDSSSLNFEFETYELMVRFEPNGERNVLYAESSTAPTWEDGQVATVITPIVYSTVLYLTPLVADGSYAVRCYRPVRDIPVARNVHPDNFSEPITVELLWPLLAAQTPGTLTYVPDYRILTVLCDFSCRRR